MSEVSEAVNEHLAEENARLHEQVADLRNTLSVASQQWQMVTALTQRLDRIEGTLSALLTSVQSLPYQIQARYPAQSVNTSSFS